MVDVVILCGGKGKRVQSLHPDLPKVLFPVEGHPFLEYVLTSFYVYGCRRFILATGYLSEKIEDFMSKSAFRDMVVISKEEIPLGTAGAVKNAAQHIETDDFIVANGDSLSVINLDYFLNFHKSHDEIASVALSKEKGRDDVGNININKRYEVTSFNEKEKRLKYINAGVYIFSRFFLSLIPDGEQSLENDILPQLLKLRNLYGYPIESPVLDIGTPERYAYVSG